MKFWSSEETFAPATETLTLTLGTDNRPVNFIDFEISLKPISVTIDYWDGSAWQPITLRTDVHSILDFTYDSSVMNPWAYAEAHFEMVSTTKLQLTFTRHTTPFPFSTSVAFAWSVEVRNLRVTHLINDLSDFAVDESVDPLGNPYRTTLFEHSPEDVADGDNLTFWKSQPNPSRFAVESLYFDLRQSEVDDEPTLVDEMYLEPLTPGVLMHIYFSNDTDEEDWDFKLWTPLPAHYILTQGYFGFPQPILCKFVKLEFSQLTPIPYNTLDYPEPPPIVYRLYPSWVQSEIGQLFPSPNPDASFTSPNNIVTVDPIIIGFKKPDDGLDSSLGSVGYTPEVELSPHDDPSQISQFLAQTTESKDAALAKAQMQEQIAFNSPEVYQTDLSLLLDPSSALSRSILDTIDQTDANTNPFVTEDPLVDLPAASVQSVSNISDAVAEKKAPILWFPRICRHQYQLIQSPRPSQIAYFVGIKTVSFTRRSYGVAAYDLDSYLETLQDDENIDYNDLTVDPTAPWRYA